MRLVRAVSWSLVAMLAAACQQSKSANPLSPDIAGPIPGVNISAPKALEPFANQTLESAQQPFTFLIENGSSSGVRPLFLQFQLASDAGFQSVVHAADQIPVGGNGRTTYRMTQSLVTPGSYHWRSRAVDGANTGPWSTAATFTLAEPVIIEAPMPVSPVGQIDQLAPTFVVRNGRVSGPAGPVIIHLELGLIPDASGVQAVLSAGIAGGATTSIPSGAQAPPSTTIYWRAYATNGTIESPRSDWAAFRTPSASTGGGPTTGSVGAPRNIGVDEAVSLIVAFHNGSGANLGSRSSRESRNAFFASAVANIYYGHVKWNQKGPDNGWCIKNGGAGRPQSDDVIVRCQSRDAWDTIGSAGADGYSFHADYIGRLPNDQDVYPPPRSALP